MKTIEVIFTDKYVESVPTSINKYLFLCNSCEVFIGDLITDERYSNKLQVINIYMIQVNLYKKDGALK